MTMKQSEFVKSVVSTGAETQMIPWCPPRWLRALSADSDLFEELEASSKTAPDGWMLLPRCAVFGVSDGSAKNLLLAAMVWGFGSVAYGPSRTQKMLKTKDAVSRLEGIVAAARTSPSAGYGALWQRGADIKYLKSAMGTKLLYFAGYDASTARGPLVVDANVLRALNHLESVSFPKYANQLTTAEYEDYIARAESWGDKAGASSDAVEYTLFELGKSLAGRGSSSRRRPCG
jgi:hypothetical protein